MTSPLIDQLILRICILNIPRGQILYLPVQAAPTALHPASGAASRIVPKDKAGGGEGIPAGRKMPLRVSGTAPGAAAALHFAAQLFGQDAPHRFIVTIRRMMPS